MNIKNTQLYTYMQGVFVVVFQVVIFLTTFFVPATILAQEKQPSKEIQSEKIEIVSEEKIEKEIKPVLEESKPVETELSKEQLKQIAELDRLLKQEKITQEEYDKKKAEIIGVKPEAEKSLASRSATQIEPEAQTLGKYIAPQISESNGSLNFSYPIVVPQGRNGLTPDIKLNYNSGNKDMGSIVGLGWSLNIPYIQRYNKTGTEELYSGDTFISSLDGELIDQGNGIYTPRTENGSFLKYEYDNDAWVVTDKSGTQYTFGTTSQARQDNPNDATEIFSWMLETITDTNGNTIDYTYFKNQGQIYPELISYVDGLYEIEFLRKSRTGYVGYAPSFEVITALMIDEVKVSTDGVLSSKYTLSSTDFLIDDITVSGYEGAVSFDLPPTEFEYIQSASTDNWQTDSAWQIPTYNNGSYDEYLDRGSSLKTADVNGDGRIDLIHNRGGEDANVNRVYLNSGTGWATTTDFTLPTYPNGPYLRYHRPSFVDINGDGLADLVAHLSGRTDNSGTQAQNKVFINNGTGWDESTTYQIPSYTVGSYDYFVRYPNYGDVNGDGLVDIISTKRTRPGNSDETENFVAINDGTNWIIDSTWQIPTYNTGSYDQYLNSGNSLKTADVNGDGLVDLIHNQGSSSSITNQVYLNTGSSWIEASNFALPTYQSGSTLRYYRPAFVDINNDGLPDLVAHRSGRADNTSIQNENKVFINNGTGWDESTTYEIPSFTVGLYDYFVGYPNYGDVNGDGLVDVISTKRTRPGNSDETENFVAINEGNYHHNLNKLTGTTGGETDFNYTSSLNQNTSNNIHFPLIVVESQTDNDGFGNISTKSYEYKDASYYFNTSFDKKFAGFGSVIKTSADGTVETTKYHQANGESGNEPTDSYAKIGKVYEKTIEDSLGNLFTRNRTNYTETSLGNNSYSILGSSELTQQFDGTGSHTDTAMSYEYDGYGNRTKLTQYGEVNGNADGTFTDSGSDNRTVDYTYTINTTDYIVGLPTSETLKNNSNVKEAETNYSYDSNGNLLAESRWISGSDYANTTYTYNSYGLPLTETDALNKVTTFSYDIHNLYPSSVTNAENHVMSYTNDYSSGKPTLVTEANGKVTEYEYDGLDRLVGIKQTFENGSPLTTKAISYNTTASPQYAKETLYRSASDTQDIYTYTDGFGKTIQTKSEMDSNWLTLDTIYDDMGRVKKQSLPYETSSSTYSSPTTNNNLLTSFVYDALGRVLSTANVKGTTATSYDGFETSITDAENNQKDLITDAFGNLIQVNEYNNGSVYETEYEYNALNLLTKITDAENNERNIDYDGLGRRTQLEDLHASGDGTYGVWSFTYNDINLTSQTDPNGTTTSYKYDDIHRVLTENNSSTAGADITYSYDSCSYGAGQLCSVVTPDVTTNLTYLKQGLIDTESKVIDGATYTTDTDYDRQGNITKETHPNNSYTEYEYNTRGLVDKVKYNSTSLVTADYGVHGRPTSYVHNNGINSTLSYDANELYELTNKTTTDGVNDFQNLNYSYDNVGNITQIIDASNTDTAKTQTFTYDDLYRLTGTNVTGSANSADYSRSYSYSPIGNITAFNGVSYSYTDTGYSNPHAVTNVGEISYTYDNNGNLINDGTWTHTWDYRNRLVSSTDGIATASYEYDHENMRTKLVEGSDTTIYPSSLYEVLNGDAKVSMSLGETLVATDDNGTINHVHTDHLGGTNITTDATGSITQTLDYFPYGDTRIDIGTDNETKQFTGYVKDASTGLQYAGARYYAGNTGRFISPDPVGLFSPNELLRDPQLFNTYSYARNNPIKYNDPTGMIPDDPQLAAGHFTLRLIRNAANLAGSVAEINANVLLAGYSSDSRAYLKNTAMGTVNSIANTSQGAFNELGDLLNNPSRTFSEYNQAYEMTTNEGLGNAAADLTFTVGAEIAGAKLFKGTSLFDNGPNPKIGEAGGANAGKPFSQQTRFNEFQNAKGKCVFCKVDTQFKGPNSPTKANTDHAIPKSRGGTNNPANAQNTCRNCNLQKGTKTTQEFNRTRKKSF